MPYEFRMQSDNSYIKNFPFLDWNTPCSMSGKHVIPKKYTNTISVKHKSIGTEKLCRGHHLEHITDCLLSAPSRNSLPKGDKGHQQGLMGCWDKVPQPSPAPLHHHDEKHMSYSVWSLGFEKEKLLPFIQLSPQQPGSNISIWMHNSVPKAASLLTVSQFNGKEYWGQDSLKDK